MKDNNKFLFEIDVEAFIEKIELSKKRRPQYYKGKVKLPKKYMSDEFVFDKNNILTNSETGERVIKNSRSVGTPNIKMITGQYFWVGAHPHIRRKIKRDMSEYFYEYFKEMPVVQDNQYPLGVRIDLYDTIRGSDIDNFIFVYRKVIHDVLTAREMKHDPFIRDDSREFIQDIPTRFYEIDDHDRRRLHIEIYSL